MADKGGEEPWAEVNYRKNRKSRGDGIEWTFLVQNLPDRVTRNILWQVFQPYGFVSDAYVARKRDARGKCFGFVRFVGVENMKETLATMNNVKIRDVKIMVSLAKYDKNHKKFNYSSNVTGRNEWRPKMVNVKDSSIPKYNDNQARDSENNQGSGSGLGGPPFVKQGESYADMLKDKKETNNQGAKRVKVDGNGALYPLHCIGRSIIGHAKDLNSLCNIKDKLEFAGLKDFGLSYVGGLSAIITMSSKENARSVMENYSELLSSMFSKFSIWNGEDIPFSRIVTINVSGVPFQVRDSKLFDRIGGLFGMVVQSSDFSWQVEDNATSSIKVVTTQKSIIDEAVVIEWKSRSYVAWVSELQDRWSPIIENDKSSESSDSGSGSDDDEMEDDIEEGEIKMDPKDDQNKNEHGGNGSNTVKSNPHQDPTKELPDESRREVGVSGDGSGSMREANGSSEGQGTPEGQRAQLSNNCMGKDGLHGIAEGAAQVTRNVGDEGDPTNSNKNVESSGPLPFNMDGPNLVHGDYGPTPGYSLRKRSRELRSPPSLGSLQGPSQRLFVNNQEVEHVDLDLNIPSGINTAGEIPDLAVDGVEP
ncbi:putative RNA recognition motif domain, nucleotide-binding alpha-beta plait domain superfamily [Helianthus annuus]|nr:putative RNA recognition motif domain, nucleotide-binding alpha-beta plait domain superfamily [Helianthus annuus]